MSYISLFLGLVCLFIPRPTLASANITVQISSVQITRDRRPRVTFEVTAAKNNPPELADLDPERVRFTIAAIERNTNGDTHYHNYVLSKISGKPYLTQLSRELPRLRKFCNRIWIKAAH